MASLTIARPAPDAGAGPWVVTVDGEGEIHSLDGAPYYRLLANLCGENPARADAISAGVRSIAGGESDGFSMEFSRRGRDGKVRVRLEAGPYRQVGVEGVILKRTDAGAVLADFEAGKMEALGRLASGVAHDFANLVTLVSGYSDILLARIGPQDPNRVELEEIRRAALRGAGLTVQILDYIRKPAAVPADVELNALVAEMMSLLKPIIGEHISLSVSLDPALGPVKADFSQLTRVVMNLVLNARDAMPQGGAIRIRTANVELDADPWHRLPRGRYVKLEISDTGAGMDSETVCQIFRPFFTTKGRAGTGLGLSTVQRIVEQAGGSIWTRSEPGRGTTFTVCLPRAEQHAEEVEPHEPARKAGAGTETILLAEDEDSVRKLLRNLLTAGGYKVLEAVDGTEALQIFERDPAGIDLLLTDVIMPGLNGRELARQALASRPELKVIYMSGYTDDVLAGAGPAGPGVPLLRKPLQLSSLETRIREVLDQ